MNIFYKFVTEGRQKLCRRYFHKRNPQSNESQAVVPESTMAECCDSGDWAMPGADDTAVKHLPLISNYYEDE